MVLWALAAGSLLLWWLHMPQAAEPPAVMASLGHHMGVVSTEAGLRALGHSSSAPAAPDAQKRYQLMGVVAGSRGQGSALIAVDGQAPQVFLVGQEVADSWRLESVAESAATLRGGQAARIVIELAGAPKN